MDIQKHFKLLEFDKIVHTLQKRTFCEKNTQLDPQGLLSQSYADAVASLDRTDEMYTLFLRYSEPGIGHIHDVTQPLTRAQKGGVLSIRELLNVARLMAGCRDALSWYRNCEGTTGVLDPYFDQLVFHSEIYRRIDSAIENEEELADTASDELFSIRRAILRAQNRAREKLDAIIHSSTQQKYLQESIVTMRDGRFVLPVKQEYKGSLPGLVHDTSQSGATLFVEPMAVVELNNEVRIGKVKEQQEIERILAELTDFVVGVRQDILYDYDLLCQIDLLMAKARLARLYDCTKPLLGDDLQIELRRARHPLIAKEVVVPVDISLGQQYDTLVITGPNTGGKTVCLKTLGLFALMAKAGLLIPAAQGSRMGYFSGIFADIGDEQSIEQSLSTFSSHLVNIVDILKYAGRGSLVLLDELGAGTDPTEGAALAIAILEHLRSVGCKTAASTHYAELKMYALKEGGVENASCEFDVESLRPTYRLITGVPGRSNAFAIAGKLGINRMIIDAAKGYVQSDDLKFEDVIESLEQKRAELVHQTELAEHYAQKARRQQEESKKEIDRRLRQAKDETERAHYYASTVIDKVKRESEQVIAEIKERHRKKDASLTPGAVRNRVDKLYDIAGKPIESDDHYQLPRPLRPGDTVTIKGMNAPAEVLRVTGKKAEVQAGAMKTTVTLDRLRLLETPKKKKSQSYRGPRSKASAKVEMEIDVRGMNVEEATMEIDSFIDQGLLSGLTQLSIIHGKGTGALRKGIHEYLRHHKNVAGYRLGTFGEGEAGVTIVTIQ
ncbi:endonuclease MutS2 [Neobittarella massiliensis]|uniref:Endonuclease MutS2 n=1 Tax=Neobittarella massiliensis (ex Bilen et al. 2018) TaxID=2041842 RepID=A0A8J6IP80_9FIRM|nr:endonuclease MutS2 [Neobittarella massiliensis]MBC3515616.1 endonuclease MutS2 [Neobittarella massiliensis]